MASRDLADVQFSTMYKVNDASHVIGVTGSSIYLGSWDPTKAILLKQREDSGQWMGGVQLPTNEGMEWKLILLDFPSKRAIRWEEQENRSLCIQSSPTNIVVPWNHRGIIVSMGQHDGVTKKTTVENQLAVPLEDRNARSDKVSPAKEAKSVTVGVAKRFEMVSPNNCNGIKTSPNDCHRYSAATNGAAPLCTKPTSPETVKTSIKPNDQTNGLKKQVSDEKKQVSDEKKPGIIERYGKYLMLGGSVAATIIATVVFYSIRK